MAGIEREDATFGRGGRADGPPEDLAVALSRIARSLEHEEDVQGTLDAIVNAAIGTVPGAQHASISVVRNRREVTTASSTGGFPV